MLLLLNTPFHSFMRQHPCVTPYTTLLLQHASTAPYSNTLLLLHTPFYCPSILLLHHAPTSCTDPCSSSLLLLYTPPTIPCFLILFQTPFYNSRRPSAAADLLLGVPFCYSKHTYCSKHTSTPPHVLPLLNNPLNCSIQLPAAVTLMYC